MLEGGSCFPLFPTKKKTRGENVSRWVMFSFVSYTKKENKRGRMLVGGPKAGG